MPYMETAFMGLAGFPLYRGTSWHSLSGAGQP
jgi:hypothetical protein